MAVVPADILVGRSKLLVDLSVAVARVAIVLLLVRGNWGVDVVSLRNLSDPYFRLCFLLIATALLDGVR